MKGGTHEAAYKLNGRKPKVKRQRSLPGKIRRKRRRGSLGMEVSNARQRRFVQFRRNTGIIDFS